jgi:hypothetical protein
MACDFVHGYLGSWRRTSWPNFLREGGNDPATPANPPVLANGKTSAATDKIYKG